ncbi:MAG: site-specific integrase [Candidatus Bathyarchaeia archaeon]
MKSLTITRGPSGRRLKQPFTLEIPETESVADRKLRQYVINTFIRWHPKLAPFTFENSTTIEVAKHLLRHRTGSLHTLRNQIYDIYRFSRWLQKSPDELLNDCKGKDQVPIPKVVIQMERLLADFADNLQEEKGMAPATVYNMAKGIQFFFQLNGVRFNKPCRRSKWSIYEERAPTPDELQKTLKVADIRGKVIIALMAVGGFRNGTLVQLKYRHVKQDLEKGTIPIHVHVEPEITKGKHHGYDTFLNSEASEYLKAYLDARKNGKIGPRERLDDESPLISSYRGIKPLDAATIQDIVNTLYVRAGVLTRTPKIKRYDLTAHSLRKFFLTQMISTGTERDYVEYMMGHTLSVYHDVKMKGVDFLRGIYVASGLSIQPRTKASKIVDLIRIIRIWELDPEEVLTQEALNQSRDHSNGVHTTTL